VRRTSVTPRRLLPVLLLAIAANGCMGYRLAHIDEIEMPSYEPREVLIPAECPGLIERAATEGMAALTEAEVRTVSFCQQQEVIRSLEEAAIAQKLEAHAAAARFALQLTTVAIGALIVFLGWVF
jgi:hypothetical protein